MRVVDNNWSLINHLHFKDSWCEDMDHDGVLLEHGLAKESNEAQLEMVRNLGDCTYQGVKCWKRLASGVLTEQPKNVVVVGKRKVDWSVIEEEGVLSIDNKEGKNERYR